MEYDGNALGHALLPDVRRRVILIRASWITLAVDAG